MAKDESTMTMSCMDSNSGKKKLVTGSMFWKTVLVDSKCVSTDLEGSCDKTEVLFYIM